MNEIGIYSLKWVCVFSSCILGTGVRIVISRLIFFELGQIGCLWFSGVSGVWQRLAGSLGFDCYWGWCFGWSLVWAGLGRVVWGCGIVGAAWVWDGGLVAVPGRFCVLGVLGGGAARISFTILDIMFRFTCSLLYMY